MSKVAMWGNQTMKPQYHMTKGECIKELTAFGLESPWSDMTVPELRLLVKENRSREGLLRSRENQDEFMAQVKSAKRDELLEMCLARQLTLAHKPTVAEMRIQLRLWVIDQGQGETQSTFGKHLGKSFHEVLSEDGQYCQWALREVQSGKEADWRLRQFASWVSRMSGGTSPPTGCGVHQPGPRGHGATP